MTELQSLFLDLNNIYFRILNILLDLKNIYLKKISGYLKKISGFEWNKFPDLKHIPGFKWNKFPDLKYISGFETYFWIDPYRLPYFYEVLIASRKNNKRTYVLLKLEERDVSIFALNKIIFPQYTHVTKSLFLFVSE